MIAVRWLLGLCGAGLALVGAVAAVGGLLGVVSGWADVVNHFAPVWMVGAAIGGLLARATLPSARGRTVALALAAVAVLVAGAPVLSEWFAGATQPKPSGKVLKIMTFNRWWDGSPFDTAAAIRRSGADIVALQEANGFERAGPSVMDLYPYQLPCPRLCDTYFLSKRPILDYGELVPPQRDARDLVWIRTPAPDGTIVTVATIHLFWPLPPWIQERQRTQLAKVVHELPGDALILTGDFNATPWSFAVRELDRTLKPLTRRTRGLLTFPTTYKVPFLAIDQIYASPTWRGTHVERLPYGGSDHYPVLATFSR
jgi:endonuclease/exonuclease/phosphatase (EEP) superfamily protein YafD